MIDLVKISSMLPSVVKPKQKLTLRDKIKWTFVILVLYYIMGSIVVWGVNPAAVSQFEFLEIVFGSTFGSLITLGIGPIVTASIILQLLVGSKIINWDLQKPEDKAKFTGTQKILAILFCFIEAVAYVAAGAIPPIGGGAFVAGFVMLQLAMGGMLIIFMDEVCSKWGIGSGVSLFIAAGVSKTILVRAFNPLAQGGVLPSIGNPPSGLITGFISSLISAQPAFLSLLPLIATIVVFLIVVFAQGMKIEIPMAFSLPFGKFASRRWPLKFIYTSNMPVILAAAVIANVQVVGRVLASRGIGLLGEFDPQGNPISGLVMFLSAPRSPSLLVVSVVAAVVALAFAVLAIYLWKKYALRMTVVGAAVGIVLGMLLVNFMVLPAITTVEVLRAVFYVLMFVIASTVFSIFWVSTSGMDAHSVANQFKASYIMIPGFRRDPRIIEKVLNNYIPHLAVLGGAFVGFLAAFADLTSALGTGTGILLTVMIIYQFYEQIGQQHMEEMTPGMRKFMGG